MDSNTFDRDWKISELAEALILAGWPNSSEAVKDYPLEAYNRDEDARSPRLLAAATWNKLWLDFVGYIMDTGSQRQAASLALVAKDDWITCMDLLGYEIEGVDMRPNGIHISVAMLENIGTLTDEPKRVAKDGKLKPKKKDDS